MNYKDKLKINPIEPWESDLWNFVKKNYSYIDDNKWYKHLNDNNIFIKSMRLKGVNEDDLKRQKRLNWKLLISGSKIKTIKDNPLNVLIAYFGIVKIDDLTPHINQIKGIESMKQTGIIEEELVLTYFASVMNSMDTAHYFENGDYSYRMTPEQFLYNLQDSQINNFKAIFKRNQIHGFKDTMYLNNSPESLNIDGVVLDSDTCELDYIVEIKVKKDNVSLSEVLDLHMDQVHYYAHLLKPKKGVLLLYKNSSRTYNYHIVSNQRLETYEKETDTIKNINKFIQFYKVSSFYANKNDFEYKLAFVPFKNKNLKINNEAFEENIDKLIKNILKTFYPKKDDTTIIKLIDIYLTIEYHLKRRPQLNILFYDDNKINFILENINECIYDYIGNGKFLNVYQKRKSKKESQ